MSSDTLIENLSKVHIPIRLQFYNTIFSSMAVNDVFQLMAAPTRRRLMELTAAQEQSVGDLVEATSLSQPAVSNHLAKLREAGLVSVREEDRKRLYRARPEGLAEMRDWLLQYGPLWTD